MRTAPSGSTVHEAVAAAGGEPPARVDGEAEHEAGRARGLLACARVQVDAVDLPCLASGPECAGRRVPADSLGMVETFDERPQSVA